MQDMSSASFGNLMRYSDSFLDRAQECGHRSFTIMAGALDGLAVKPRTLSHEATFGVGYGFVIYDIEGTDDSRHFLDTYEAEIKEECRKKTGAADAYVKLAVQTIHEWVLHHRRPDLPQDLPEEMMKERAGVFVSIHKFGSLRGCIGTIGPVRSSIAKEIIENGISACSRDPRFDPVTEEELPYLEVSVDVLSEPEPAAGPEDLDVKRYGVIVSSEDGRRGLLLPNLEGVDTVEEQINIARSKGGIGEYEDYQPGAV